MNDAEKAAEMELQLLHTLSAIRDGMKYVEGVAQWLTEHAKNGEMFTENTLGLVEDAVKLLELASPKVFTVPADDSPPGGVD